MPFYRGECNTVSQDTCVASLTGKWQFLKLKTSVQSVDLETKSIPIVDDLDAWLKAGITHLLSLVWITIYWFFQPQFRYSQERMMGWDIRLISNKFSRLQYIAGICTFSVLDLRPPNNTGHLFLLFFFQFSFFLWIKLSIFLLFLFAFVFFPLITHICFSLFESDYTDLDIITIVMLSVLKFHRLS